MERSIYSAMFGDKSSLINSNIGSELITPNIIPTPNQFQHIQNKNAFQAALSDRLIKMERADQAMS